MASLFLSHSHRDDVAAAWLAGELRGAGFDALYLDFDPEQGTPAGHDWEHELYSELRRSDAIVYLASAASADSRWCFTELALARSIGKPVFAVALDDTPGHDLLDHLQWVSLRSEPHERAVRRLVHGLARAGVDPKDAFTWNAARPPYPGLDPFVAEDAAVFFGRAEEIDRCLVLLEPTILRDGGRFVAVVGPSGSGKSSLVRAGVLPRLRRSSDHWVVLPPFAPGRRPTDALARSLARPFADPASKVEEIRRRLRRGGEELMALAEELCDAASGQPRATLIVLDQAEELVTLAASEERAAFLDLLHGSLHEASPVWVLGTVRSEFLGAASPERGLADVIDDALILEPLSRSRLPEVIERPAQRAGLEFQAGLVQRIVSDAEGGDALPLLAYTLRQLYERSHDRPHRTVTFEDYEAIGGVEGALGTRADLVADEVDRRGLGHVVLPALLKLATLDRDGKPTRRRVDRDTLTEPERTVLEAFVDARLLRSARRSGRPTIEVAHEALLRQWPPLREAIEGSKRSLQIRSELERLAAEWDRNERDPSYLVRGERLVILGDWSDEHPTEMGPLERNFVAASRRLATSELDASRRTNRRLRVLVAGLGVALAALAVVALIARDQTREAQDQARRALSQRLALQVPAVARTQPDLALLLGLQSLRLAGEDERDASQSALLAALQRPHHIATTLEGHSDQVRDVAFSPDGRMVATASLDGTIRRWNASTGHARGRPLRGHAGGVLAVAFGPDGRRLASGGQDGTVRLWDATTGRALRGPLRAHAGGVADVAFSPDGAMVASAGADRAVRLWDTRTGRPRGEPLRGHTDAVTAVAFSPDGEMLASASDDRSVRRWNVVTGEPVGDRMPGHTDAVLAVAFSPDGEMLVSAGDDSKIRRWHAASGAPRGRSMKAANSVRALALSGDGRTLASAGDDRVVQLWDPISSTALDRRFLGHADTVGALAFSPDGRRLASASDDRTARLWQTATVQPPTLTGHEAGVSGVAFSPDGRTIATGSLDDTLRLWDAATRRPRGKPIRVGGNGIWEVVFSPDGGTIALARFDGVVSLHDAATGHRRVELDGHGGEVWDVAFSPDGRTLAAAANDETLRLWDVRSGRPRGRVLRGHAAAVLAVAFSPDGRTLASGGVDRSVRLWDVATGATLHRLLRGHDQQIVALAFSPDGKVLASAGFDETVRSWDPRNGRERGEPLSAHSDGVADVAFSPDGTTLASAGFDRTVRLWDAATLRLRTPLVGHTKQVWDIAFSPDSRTIAAGGEDHTVRLWRTTTDALVARACTIANRNLSQSEWEWHLGSDVAYERTCGGLPAGAGAPEDAPAARY